MTSPEVSQFIGIPLVLAEVGPERDPVFSHEDLVRVEAADFDVIGNLVAGGEDYIQGVANTFRDHWQAQLLEEGHDYPEAVRRSSHYAVGQYEHLHEATRIGTLRLPQMDNLTFAAHVKQVAEAGSRVRSLRG